MISRGDPGPPIVLCHGDHAVVAGVGEAVRVASRGGVPRRRLRRPRPRGVDRRRHRPLDRQPRRRPAAACSRPSTSTTRCSWATRWAAWRCRRSRCTIPRRSRQRVRGLVLMSTSPRALVSDAHRTAARARARRRASVPDVGAVHAPAQPRSARGAARVRRRPEPGTWRRRARCSASARARPSGDAGRALLELDLTARAARASTCPTLVVVGTADLRHAAARRAPDRRAGARRAAGRDARARAHADVRAHRRSSTTLVIDFARACVADRRCARRSGAAHGPCGPGRRAVRPDRRDHRRPRRAGRALDRHRHRRHRGAVPRRHDRVVRGPRRRARDARDRAARARPHRRARSTRSCSPAARRSGSRPPTA